jgi:serine/threonine-protein kinase
MTRLLGARYEVQELIGAGGMADVYRGYDNRLHRVVAIKILRADLARDPSLQSRFRREAQAAARLNHPNIVSVYDTGEEQQEWGTLPYIVMEYVEGTTIRELLRQDVRPDYQESLRIAHSLLDALTYSHENGIVHRDIKPANIMVTTVGEIKVMDFGIARPLDDVTATVTHAWTVIGTAQYLSPEQARGEIADSRSDIYSVGCLLYELLTGRAPFSGDTPVAIAYQHVSAKPISVDDLNPDLPAGLSQIIDGALAKDPLARYQSAAEMLADLDRISKGERVKIRVNKNIDRRKIIAAAIALVVALGSGGVLLSRGGSAITSNSVADVSGLTEVQAREALAGFTVVIAHAPDPRVPEGRVALQNPVAGTKAKSNSDVTITISDGPGKTSIPTNLIGKSLEDVRLILSSLGLVLSRTNAVDSSESPGTVDCDAYTTPVPIMANALPAAVIHRTILPYGTVCLITSASDFPT